MPLALSGGGAPCAAVRCCLEKGGLLLGGLLLLFLPLRAPRNCVSFGGRQSRKNVTLDQSLGCLGEILGLVGLGCLGEGQGEGLSPGEGL